VPGCTSPPGVRERARPRGASRVAPDARRAVLTVSNVWSHTVA
jgi:hypothetical protein